MYCGTNMYKYFTDDFINSSYTSITTLKGTISLITDPYELVRQYNTFYLNVLSQFDVNTNYKDVKYKTIVSSNALTIHKKI